MHKYWKHKHGGGNWCKEKTIVQLKKITGPVCTRVKGKENVDFQMKWAHNTWVFANGSGSEWEKRMWFWWPKNRMLVSWYFVFFFWGGGGEALARFGENPRVSPVSVSSLSFKGKGRHERCQVTFMCIISSLHIPWNYTMPECTCTLSHYFKEKIKLQCIKEWRFLAGVNHSGTDSKMN